MRLIVFLAGLLLTLAHPGWAQRQRLASINAESPEGQALQAISTEADQARKLALMEDFVAKFPKNEGTPWVLSQMQALYGKAGDHAKAIASGEKLLQLDGMDAQAAYANLKSAEALKDPDAILRWSAVTADIAQKLPSSPKPAQVDDDEWKHELDFANQVVAYTEYALYSAALQETDPQRVMKLAAALEQRNPKSQYLVLVMPKVAQAGGQANAMDQAVAFGERAYERGLMHEDMLLAMADYYSQKKQPEKAIAYSGKVIELMGSKSKPEGVSDADWQRKKDATSGLAYWIAGTTQATQAKYPAADKSLRSALPLIQENDQLRAGALFYLGLANYQMGKGKNAVQLAEALKFSQQSAAIKSPFQAQALKNVAIIQKETGGARRAR